MRPRVVLLLALGLLAAGCVTINVGQPPATQTTLPTQAASTVPGSAATTTSTLPPATTTCPPPPAGMPPIPEGAPCPQPGSMPPSQPSRPSPPSQPSAPAPTGGAAVDASRKAIVLAQFLCVDAPITVDDYTTSAVGGLACRVTLDASTSTLKVKSTTIPNHDFESGGGCCAAEADRTWDVPLAPVNDTDGTLTPAPERGAIAIAVNGAQIYGPEEANGADVVGSSTGITLGLCSAHSAPSGDFHYHADANCVRWVAPSGQTWKDYSFAKIAAFEHSPIIGFAFDGYPIYGTYGWDESGAVKEMKSSYRLKAGKTGSDASNDYEHVAGLGDLDACNGRWARTPEFPGGTYAYHSTRHNGQGAAGYPYFLACYHGVASASATMTMPSGGGGAGGSVQPPPGGGGGGMMMPPPGG